MLKKRNLRLIALSGAFALVSMICVFGLGTSFRTSPPPNPICAHLVEPETIVSCDDGQVVRSIVETFPLRETTRPEVRRILDPFFLRSKNMTYSDGVIDVYHLQDRFLYDSDELSFRFSSEGILEGIWVKSDGL